MIRVLIGSILGGIAQWIVGAFFWATPLGKLPFHVAPDQANANVQQALAANLTPTGTGTYYIPWPDSAQGTVLHGRGPVALIHFNTNGFPVMSGGSLIAGLVLSILTILLVGLALYAVAGRVQDFGTRAKLVSLFACAATLYFTLGEPVFNSYLPWGYFIYLALSQVIGLIAGGLVVARWFLPRASASVTGTVH
jgi:hypothetical protein